MPTSNTPPDFRSLLGQTVERSFTVERGKVNPDDRTIELSFSSETPVEQYNWEIGRYLEILDHSPGACDLTRLNTSGAFLVCHDRYDLAGGVDSARIDADRIGRAVIRFSPSVRGQEIEADINLGIRKGISFRYIVREMELVTRDKDGLDTYRITKWEPTEISTETVPGDITVGPGRTLAEAERARFVAAGAKLGLTVVPAVTAEARTDTTSSAAAPPAAAPNSPTPLERTSSMPEAILPAATLTPPVNTDLLRMQDIAALGDLVGMRSFADDLALGGKTYDEARTAIAAKRTADQAATSPAVETAEAIAARTQNVPATVTSRVRLKNFKTQEEAFRYGQFLGGVLGMGNSRTWCNENGFSLKRAQSESDNESGGIWVPKEFSETTILLREQNSLVRQFGDVETMTSNTKSVRRQKEGLTAYPSGAVGASRKTAQSQMKWDMVELLARKWRVTTKVEEELTDDATISFADKFAGESNFAFGKAEDNAFFNGDGTAAYHGIIGLRAKLRKVHATIANIKGLVVASGNLFSEFIQGDFLNTVAALPAYADNEKTAWYMHRTFFWNTVVPLMLAAGGTTVKEIEQAPTKVYLSYPVRLVQSLPRTNANSQIPALLGDVSLSSTFGDRQGQQMKVTDTNDDDWDNDLISMKSIERFDVNHHDVGDTVEAGPVVGIISAAS